MKTVEHSYAILALLRSLTGTPSSGLVTASTAAGSGTALLKKRQLGYPVPVSAAGVAQEDPLLAVRVTEDTVIGEAGTDVPVESVWGSARHNLPAGTKINWYSPPANVTPKGTVAAGGLTGAAPGAIRRVSIYEGVSAGAEGRDLWLAQAGGANAYPALVLSWDGSQDYSVAGPAVRMRSDRWTAMLVVARMSGAIGRAAEGLDLLDELEELLVAAEAEPLGYVSSPPLDVTSRNRVATTDTSYLYAVRFSTWGGVRAAEGTRTFATWLRTRIELSQPATPTPPIPATITPVDTTEEMPQPPP